MKLRTAYEIFDQMADVAPFKVSENIKPYVIEAIQLAQREALEAAAENGKVVPERVTRHNITGNLVKKIEYHVDKQSILNLLP